MEGLSQAWVITPSGDLHVFGLSKARALARGSRHIYDVGEVYAGVQHIVRAARSKNFRAVGFDILREEGVTDVRESVDSEDITSEDGFNNALTIVLGAWGKSSFNLEK